MLRKAVIRRRRASGGVAGDDLSNLSIAYAGESVEYTVQNGVTEVSFALGGGAGGGSSTSFGVATDYSGAGGFTSGRLSVSPGDVILVQVGQGGRGGVVGTAGAGGWPDGGDGKDDAGDVRSGGGGGSTRIFLNNVLQAVAGGGGGGGYSTNGDAGPGGGLVGENAGVSGGSGGTQSAAGLDQSDTLDTAKQGDGPITSPTLPTKTGGDGGDGTAGDDGGGGGGGYYGGGGGGTDGDNGGGGSGYVSGAAILSATSIGRARSDGVPNPPVEMQNHHKFPNTGESLGKAHRSETAGGDGWAAIWTDGTIYEVSGYEPGLVLDFENGYFKSESADGTDLGAAVGGTNHERGGLASQVDSSGNIVWCPHNLALNSASPATQNITVVSGAQYTVEMTGTGSITLSGAGSGTVTAGSPVEITASTTTLTCTVSGSPTTMWAYRSDLGGMAPVPTAERAGGSSTYLPTTGAQRFLKRQQHYVGATPYMLLEPAAATNNILQSRPTTADWTNLQVTDTENAAVSPSGETDATGLVENTANNAHYVQEVMSGLSSATDYYFSCFVKRGSSGTRHAFLSVTDNVGSSGGSALFNLDTGAFLFNKTAGPSAPTVSGETITDYGNGWYRIGMSINFPSTTPVYAIVGLSDRTTDTGLYTVAKPQYTGDNTSELYVWGAQFEVGHIPTSYIPTLGGTVTRGQDTSGLPIATAALPVSGKSTVSFAIDALVTYADEGVNTQQRFVYWLVDGSNYISSYLDTNTGGGGTPSTIQNAGAVVDAANAGDVYTAGVHQRVKIGYRHNRLYVQAAADGTAGTLNDTPTDIADLSSAILYVGNAGTATTSQMLVRSFRMWGADIGESGIEVAST